MGSHVRPGAAGGRSPGAVGEHPGRQHDVVPVDAGLRCDVVEVEGADRGMQLVEAPHPASAELGVVAALVEDDAQQAGEQRRVLARADLEEQVGRGGHLGAARIDHDQLPAPLLGLADRDDRVDRRRPAWVAEQRHRHVLADHQRHVGGGERLVPGGPAAVAQRHEDLAGLVDGERRVEGGRPEGLVERPRRGQADGVAVHRGAAVAGDRARPVLGHDGLQPLGDLVEGAAGGDLLEAALRAPLEGGAEAIGVVVLVAEVPALHAGVAAEDRVGLVAAHAHDPVVVDVDLDGARGVAEAAERPLGLDRHGEPPDP